MERLVNNTSTIRKLNKKKILAYLINHDKVSKKEIALKTDLSPSTVSNLSNQLIQEGFILLASYQKSQGGRNAGLLTVRNNQKYYLALRLMDDLMVEAALISFEKEIVCSFLEPVQTDTSGSLQTMEYLLQACERAAASCRKEAEACKGQILGAGIALPGIVDTEQGVLLNSTIKCLEGQPVINELQQRLNCPVVGANESDILALTLANRANQNGWIEDTIYLHLDDGLGVGIICNGSLLTGNRHRGGEISHIPIGTKNLRCSCGQRGCVETELSVGGFLLGYEESTGDRITWKNLCQIASSAPYAVQPIMAEKGKLLGKLLFLLDAMFDPAVFYLGGRGVELFDQLAPYADAEYRTRQFLDKKKVFQIKPCQDYDKLLLIGCADLIFDFISFQDSDEELPL